MKLIVTSSTSSLRSHLAAKHPGVLLEEKAEQRSGLAALSNMVMLIVTGLTSFSVVENQFFRNLDGSSVSRHAVVDHMLVVDEQVMNVVKQALSRAVAVSLLTEHGRPRHRGNMSV